MTFPQVLERVVDRQDLTVDEATNLMGQILQGSLGDAQLGGFLIALKAKGASASELAGFALAMQQSAEKLECSYEGLVDTCGTGGGPATFNLSTAAAIVAASAGAKVAKHGNRAVTSKCGSADVLEALGVKLDIDRTRQAKVLDEVGIVFMFAPHHHPAMRHVGPTRKALGVRTVFNQLGPLANPAGAKRQLIGVYDKSLMRPMAGALVLLGSERSFVVHSEEGMDEISPCGRTFVMEVREGTIREYEVEPADFGMTAVPFPDLAPGESAQDAAEILRNAIGSRSDQRSNALVPNAAVALMLAGVASDCKSAADIAREAIDSGRAKRTLEELVKWTS